MTLLQVCTGITFYTFYNLPFLLLSHSGLEGPDGVVGSWLALLRGGAAPSADLKSNDPAAEERRLADIRASVLAASAAVNASWLKKAKAARHHKNKAPSASLDLPVRCMASMDCKRACRKSCLANSPACPEGTDCKRGREARLEQHATVRARKLYFVFFNTIIVELVD